jgi:hypothetical protein
MTPQQLEAFLALLAANRQPVHRGEQYAHPRGWNDALDFVERSISRITGPEETKGEGTPA